jgi:hypothetical protein
MLSLLSLISTVHVGIIFQREKNVHYTMSEDRKDKIQGNTSVLILY